MLGTAHCVSTDGPIGRRQTQNTPSISQSGIEGVETDTYVAMSAELEHALMYDNPALVPLHFLPPFLLFSLSCARIHVPFRPLFHHRTGNRCDLQVSLFLPILYFLLPLTLRQTQ